MSEKPIHQILKGLSILALVYYTASSINCLFDGELEAQNLSQEFRSSEVQELGMRRF